MSRRITSCFTAAAEQGRKVLIPFITAGDPDPEWTVDIMHALVDGGADLIELGVPFSDPMADGPVIQMASERAIDKGVTITRVLEMVTQFRQDDVRTPVVLMGYMNPLQRYGLHEFPAAAKTAGVDGLLIVDCPPEERDALGIAMHDADIDGVCLVAPTTTRERVRLIAGHASGFVYYVSLKGITGSAELESAELRTPLKQIREFCDLPVAVGFGIKSAEMAVAVAAHADGVVIGSALVESLARAVSREQARALAKAFVAPVRDSLDNMSG